MRMLKVGIIGYGQRTRELVGLMHKLDVPVTVVAIADLSRAAVSRRADEDGMDPDGLTFYEDADKMLDSEELDGVMVGTRCSLHSCMAIKALRRNLPLFLEKPVATTMEDLLALRDAEAASASEVVVSFPLRMTPLVQLAKEIVDSGKIGNVEHLQAWNNVSYAQIYFQSWYRDENETGGLFLQKATHDLDYINYLLGLRPRRICAMTSKQVYKGNHPAGLRCRDCNERDTCADSPYSRSFAGPTWHDTSDYQCAFAVDTGNEDSGSALIEYETGMHACYTQNFLARRGAGKRGATLLGYKGTLEFDWDTSELKVYMHHVPRTELYKINADPDTHDGGDDVLISNFVQVMRGEGKSVSPLGAGLLSVLMCLKARESAATRTFQEIGWPDIGDLRSDGARLYNQDVVPSIIPVSP